MRRTGPQIGDDRHGERVLTHPGGSDPSQRLQRPHRRRSLMSTTSNVLLAIGPPTQCPSWEEFSTYVMARSSPARPRSARELRDRAGELRDRHRPTSGNFVIANKVAQRRCAGTQQRRHEPADRNTTRHGMRPRLRERVQKRRWIFIVPPDKPRSRLSSRSGIPQAQ